MRLLVIGLEDELASEIERDMNETMQHESPSERGHTDVAAWVTQIVEAHLASRRLRTVKSVLARPRMFGETALSRAPRVAEHRDAGPMTATEIPTLDELGCLVDIV
jgi:hypothetical protein